MKICIMSDTHLSANKYSKMDHDKGLNRYLVRQFESLEWVADYLKKNGIKTIVHSGDVFDSPRVSVYPIVRAREIFKDFDVYAIKGNHDDNNFLHQESLSALDLIGINAYNEPDTKVLGGVNFAFIPWGFDPDESYLKEGMKNVLVAHGFPRSYREDWDVVKNTNLFDLVITGHYHSIDEFTEGKTRYLNPGSISATAGDSGRNPRIWILDTDTLEYEGVDIPCAVKIVKSNPKDVNSYLAGIEEEDIYRIYVPSKQDIDTKALVSAKKKALDLQLKLVHEESPKADAVDEFWKYIEENTDYMEEFTNKLKELRHAKTAL